MGRPFEIEHIPLEALQQQLLASEDPMETSFAGLMYCYAVGGHPWAVDMDKVLDQIPLRLTSLEEFCFCNNKLKFTKLPRPYIYQSDQRPKTAHTSKPPT